eukprot:161660_1
MTKDEFRKSLKLKYPSNITGPTKELGDAHIMLLWAPHGDIPVNKGYPMMYIWFQHDLKVRCKWSFSCPELQMSSSWVNVFDPNGNIKWGWAAHKGVQPSTVKNLKKISFTATLTILNVYDKNNNNVPKNKWDKYLGITNDVAPIVAIDSAMDSDTINAKLSSVSDMVTKLQDQVNTLQSYVFVDKQNDKNGQNITNVSCELLLVRQRYASLQQQIYDMGNGNKNNINRKLSKKEELRKWLKDTVDLEEYFDILVENGYDEMESVKLLRMNELTLLIEKMGHRAKLMRYIAMLNLQFDEGATNYI